MNISHKERVVLKNIISNSFRKYELKGEKGEADRERDRGRGRGEREIEKRGGKERAREKDE